MLLLASTRAGAGSVHPGTLAGSPGAAMIAASGATCSSASTAAITSDNIGQHRRPPASTWWSPAAPSSTASAGRERPPHAARARHGLTGAAHARLDGRTVTWRAPSPRYGAPLGRGPRAAHLREPAARRRRPARAARRRQHLGEGDVREPSRRAVPAIFVKASGLRHGGHRARRAPGARPRLPAPAARADTRSTTRRW